MAESPASEHVHDCTGPTMTCPCGFVFKVARFYVSVSVYDNDTKRHVASDSFSTDNPDLVRRRLLKAAANVEFLP